MKRLIIVALTLFLVGSVCAQDIQIIRGSEKSSVTFREPTTGTALVRDGEEFKEVAIDGLPRVASEIQGFMEQHAKGLLKLLTRLEKMSDEERAQVVDYLRVEFLKVQSEISARKNMEENMLKMMYMDLFFRVLKIRVYIQPVQPRQPQRKMY